jgi:hypothetical protein
MRIALIAAGFLLVAGAAEAQSITGLWTIAPDDYNSTEANKRMPMPLNDKAKAMEEARRKQTNAAQSTLSEHALKCLPIGMPGMMANEFALEFLETPGRVTILSENSPLPRTVYLTEKLHTGGLEPSWNGHSIGHWEGKILVVDTVNFNDRIGPITGRGVHSPTTHLVERIHLEGPDKLTNEMTFEDPTYLTAPYTRVVHYDRVKGLAELWEYACETDAAGWSERFAGDTAFKAAAKK